MINMKSQYHRLADYSSIIWHWCYLGHESERID